MNFKILTLSLLLTINSAAAVGSINKSPNEDATIVAVIDSYVDLGHEYLKGRCIEGESFLLDKSNHEDHGTSIAGAVLKYMAVSQQSHRQALEQSVIKADIRNSKRGSWFGFILGIIGFAVSAYALYLGQPAAAIAIGSASLVSLAGVFVYGTKSRRAERDRKNKENS